MLNKLKDLGREIVKQFAISFFFCCLVFVILYFLFSNKITAYLSLINMMSIKDTSVLKEPVKFDIEKKKLTNYPLYRELWATLKIEDIDLELPVYHGDTLDILKKGVGHFSGSYFPGEGGSIILDAHNNKGIFRRLPEVKEGAIVTIIANYGTFTYRVKETKIIDYKDTSQFPIQQDEELLMMYTCYPVNTVGLKTQRFVVYAELIGEVYE